jgi:DNA-binding FadR family transcriptional regulator
MGEVSGNSMTGCIYLFVMELFAPTIHARNAEVLTAHEELCEAIRQRDLERAERAVDRHTRIWCRLQNIDFVPAVELKKKPFPTAL